MLSDGIYQLYQQCDSIENAKHEYVCATQLATLLPETTKPNLVGWAKFLILLLYSGADCRDRTGHLMITNQLLYQMS